MIERIKQFFVEDDYNYILKNLSKTCKDKYRLKISVDFYIKNKHYNTRGFLSKEETCKLLNMWVGWTWYLLYCYEKLWVINWFNLCEKKNKEQEDFYNELKWSEYWDFWIQKDCFDYEIDLEIEKFKFFWRAVFENADYWIPTRCINDLIWIIEALGIKYDELLDFLKITADNPHHYKSNYLIIFSICDDMRYLEKLFNFIDIVGSENSTISKKIEILRKLIDESWKKRPWIYISDWVLTIQWETSALSWDQRKICEEIFREPWKPITKTRLMEIVYKSDEKDHQLDEQIKKINQNKIYNISKVWGIRQESWNVFYDKNFSRKK
jgi:hypothetical protein